MDGENDLRKAAAYIRSERTKELESLKLGEFIYDKGSETKKINTSEFKPKVFPRKLECTPQRLPEQMIKPQNTEQQKSLTSLGIALIFLAALIVALQGMI